MVYYSQDCDYIMQDKGQQAADVKSEAQFQEDESFDQSENDENAPI